MAPDVLTLRELNRATLARQMLLAREDCGPVETVERLAGMQAQEPKPPFIGLWSRVAGFQRDDLADALNQREVVRGPLMRGTLHLASARRWWAHRRALEPMMTRSLRGFTGGIEGEDSEQVLAAGLSLLRRHPMEFKQWSRLVEEAFPHLDERGIRRALRTQLPLVMVPSDERWGFSRSAEFALAEEWVGPPPDDASPQPLVRDYLAAFGPASAADFQEWSGLQGMDAVFDGMGLVSFRDERGRSLFDLVDAPRPSGETPAPIRLLPEFDSLVLAFDDRTRVVAEEHRPALATKNLRILSTFLVDGFVAGIWALQRRGKKAVVSLSPFATLRRPVKDELGDEARRVAEFAEPQATAVEVVFE